MWLTLLGPIDRVLMRLEGYQLIVREAEWLWEVRTCMDDKIPFMYFFMCFLSNYRRSGNLFVGDATSITHFAHACAQRAWRGISVLDHPFGSENWRYVDSTVPTALLDNVLDRLLVYLYDVMNLLIHGDAYEKSPKLANETIIQNIKVSHTRFL